MASRNGKDLLYSEEIVIWSTLAGDCEQLVRAGRALRALLNIQVNSWECDQTKVFANAELSDLTCAIGTGLFTAEMTEEEVQASMDKLRYGKIIIMADADIDGSHIECLLLGHLYRHALPLIERGNVYIALPPLYRVAERGKHTFLKDEKALAAFFRKRAKSAVGTDTALSALAAVASQVRLAIETAAGAVGIIPSDLGHALRALVSYDDQREDWVRAFAERIYEIRASECEGVEAGEIENGAIIISGLEASGRYFTTVIDESFYTTVSNTWTALAGIIKHEETLSALTCEGARNIGDIQCFNIYQMACEIEKASRKGITVQRNKGLGEMQAEELGETTLDRETRRLIRVTVEDFDIAGEFVGSMLSKNDVEARREVVRNVDIDRELIDA